MPFDHLLDITRRAGRIAMEAYGKDRGNLKPDGTWVTSADRRVEDFLRNEIESLLDARVFGEENGWSGSESAPCTAVIDPIDGTSLFSHHIPLWAVSVAVFRESVPWLGIFDMPAIGQCFVSEYGKRVELNGEPLRLAAPEVVISAAAYLGVSSDAHRWDLTSYPGKIRAFGSSGFHVVSVASGSLQAGFLTSFRFHDIAAAAVILRSAGGEIYYLSGEPVSAEDLLDSRPPRQPVIACHPRQRDEMLKVLKPMKS